MRFSGLLTRSNEALPGITGIGRVGRRTEAVLRKVGPGDIAISTRRTWDGAF